MSEHGTFFGDTADVLLPARMTPRRPLTPDGYEAFLRDLKARIRLVQVRAALAVNAELVLLYWRIGHDILERQTKEGWGSQVIDRLSADVRRAFPDMKGFSPRNVKYMRAFAIAWPDEEIVQQLVALLPWGHNVRLLERLSHARIGCSGARSRARLAGARARLSPRARCGIRVRR